MNAAIQGVRPTQMTFGYREVVEKRRHWREARDAGEQRMLHRRVVPIVLGPRATYCVLRGHHWLCGLGAEGVSDVPVVVVADQHDLDLATFWSDLNRRGWRRPFDAQGRRRAYPRFGVFWASRFYRSSKPMQLFEAPSTAQAVPKVSFAPAPAPPSTPSAQ